MRIMAAVNHPCPQPPSLHPPPPHHLPPSFFLSLEDPLFRVFGGDKVQAVMAALKVDDAPIQGRVLSNALDTAQKRVEAHYFDMRKHVYEYDAVVNTQRDRVYAERRRALMAGDLGGVMADYAARTADDMLEANISRVCV